MPTYQYACTACDERLEAVQSFTDTPLTECSACGGALRKVFSAVGVVFKGSGFYKTDSRGSKGDGAKAGGAKSDSGSSDGSTAAGSSPPAAKTGSSDSGSSASPAPAATSTSSSTPASKSA